MKSNEMGCYGSVFISPLPDHGVQQERYDLNLWIGHLCEGATYLPR
jgi:hypothetical protein